MWSFLRQYLKPLRKKLSYLTALSSLKSSLPCLPLLQLFHAFIISSWHSLLASCHIVSRTHSSCRLRGPSLVLPAVLHWEPRPFCSLREVPLATTAAPAACIKGALWISNFLSQSWTSFLNMGWCQPSGSDGQHFWNVPLGRKRNLKQVVLVVGEGPPGGGGSVLHFISWTKDLQCLVKGVGNIPIKMHTSIRCSCILYQYSLSSVLSTAGWDIFVPSPFVPVSAFCATQKENLLKI